MERALKKRIILNGTDRTVITYKDQHYLIKNGRIVSTHAQRARADAAFYNDMLYEAIKNIKFEETKEYYVNRKK